MANTQPVSYKIILPYVCLACGSFDGTPLDDVSENWYWRMVPHGRVGPFCSQVCSAEFVLPDAQGESRFTLREWECLRFIRATLADVQEARAGCAGHNARLGEPDSRAAQQEPGRL